MQVKLYTVDEVSDFISHGKTLSLAGDESLLAKLPKGNWIGGTIPYFMGLNTSLFTKELIYVNDFSEFQHNFTIKSYSKSDINNIIDDAYNNGYTIVIFPPFTEVHIQYATQIPKNENLFNNPIIGWVAGIDLNSNNIARTYNGLRNQVYIDTAVAIHVELPQNKLSRLDIVNIFDQSEENIEIQFLKDGFNCETCLINGEEINFAQYIYENNIDTKLPIISDYSGALINVSFRSLTTKTVDFYAPVFKDKIYKFAKPISDYVSRLNSQIIKNIIEPEFSCNCILNYLYGEMEGKKIENVSGPITFGEIGYQLLNQTMVSLHIVEDIESS